MKGWFVLTVAYFVGLVIAGFGMNLYDHSERQTLYATFKDLIPLLVAAPLTWLAYCLQLRTSFLRQLRPVWTNLVDAVQTAIQYTYLRKPTVEDHNAALLKLGVAIDQVRGVFSNFNETENEHGSFPFDPIKNIYGLISELGAGDAFKKADAERIRLKVFSHWKDVRFEFLKEFDREPTSFSYDHWSELKKAALHSSF
jgi:hypothetical protein